MKLWPFVNVKKNLEIILTTGYINLDVQYFFYKSSLLLITTLNKQVFHLRLIFFQKIDAATESSFKIASTDF